MIAEVPRSTQPSTSEAGPSPRVLVFAQSTTGGIAKYVSAQTDELARQGCDVHVLCAGGLELVERPPMRVSRRLWRVSERVRPRALRRILFALSILANHARLAITAASERPAVVLFDAYSETLAPLWAWAHVLIGRLLRITYVVTIHDPARRRWWGPDWWHRLSVRAAYAPFQLGLWHGAASGDQMPPHLRLLEVPHGMFSESAAADRSAARRALGVDDDGPIALCFGHVADRKNLDLVLQAAADVDRLHVVIAGRPSSESDRPVSFYRELAARLNLGPRVHFIEEYVSDAKAAELFAAADVVMLTYRADFSSQSGVLHVAGNWDKPVLASGEAGPLIEAVRAYDLGLVVEPDSAPAIAAGLRRILRGDHPSLGWGRFRDDASWTTNVSAMLRAVRQLDRTAAR